MHISDLTALYELLANKILKKELPPSGEEGYYFAIAHSIYFGEFLDQLAVALHARGLVIDAKTETFANDEEAAAALRVPMQYVQVLWNSG